MSKLAMSVFQNFTAFDTVLTTFPKKNHRNGNLAANLSGERFHQPLHGLLPGNVGTMAGSVVADARCLTREKNSVNQRITQKFPRC